MRLRTRPNGLRLYPSGLRPRSLRIAQAMVRIAGLSERIKLLAGKYEVAEGMVQYVLTLDPTGGKYLDWLVKNFKEETTKKDGMLRNAFTSVLETLSRYIKKFDEWKKTKRGKDFLNQYKDNGSDIFRYSMPELFALVQESMRAANSPVYDKNGVKIYQAGGPGQDPEAAQEFACSAGVEGEWCTLEPDKAKKYLSKAPLFIVYYGNKAVAQLHVNPDSLNSMELRGPGNKSLRYKEESYKPIFLALLDLFRDDTKMVEQLLAEATGWAVDYPEELMPYVLRSPEWAYRYAMEKEEPIPEAESMILQDISIAVRYASYVKRERWPELEKKIMEEIQKLPNIPPATINAILAYETRFKTGEIMPEFNRVMNEHTSKQKPAASRALRRLSRIAYQLVS